MSVRKRFVAVGAAISIVAMTLGAHAQSNTDAWNGPYVGGIAGYGWGNSTQRDLTIPLPPEIEIPVPADGNYHAGGGLAGVTTGYNLVFDHFLIGIEGDTSWTNIDGSSSNCGGNHVCGTKLQGVSTERIRAGVLTGASLLYATGGIAIGRIHAYDETAPGYSATKTKVGWAAGGGIEHRWSDKWSTKLEYLYMDLGTRDYFTIAGHTPERVSLEVHSVRIGLNYRFGTGLEHEPLK